MVAWSFDVLPGAQKNTEQMHKTRMAIGMKKTQLYRALGRPPWTSARSRIRLLMIGLRSGFSIVERVEGRWNLEGVK